MHICLNPEYWADTLEVAKFVLLCMSIGMFIVYMLLQQHANETKQPALSMYGLSLEWRIC